MVDPKFHVSVVSFTHFPQTLVKNAAKVCHSGQVCKLSWEPKSGDEEVSNGEWVVKHLLSGSRGHYGPLEHPQITFLVSGYPHSAIQQLTRHRIGATYDVQSFRHCNLSGEAEIEDLIYIRPIGQGMSESERQLAIESAKETMVAYNKLISKGVSVETARSILPADYRQRFVATFNMRSLMHIISVREKGNAQLEIRDMVERFNSAFGFWAPQINNWFRYNHKGLLAP